jgi:hypothetical protein
MDSDSRSTILKVVVSAICLIVLTTTTVFANDIPGAQKARRKQEQRKAEALAKAKFAADEQWLLVDLKAQLDAERPVLGAWKEKITFKAYDMSGNLVAETTNESALPLNSSFLVSTGNASFGQTKIYIVNL